MRQSTHSPRRSFRTIERLEYRWLLSSVVLQSVSTVDSQSLTLKYQIEGASLNSSFDVGVYRSEDGQFDPNHLRSTDETIGQVVVGGVDDNQQNALAVGTHTETVELPAKLGIDPLHPFVYAVADPDNQLGTGNIQDRTAFFHKYVLGVVTHGLELSMPAWVGDMATSLEQTDHYQQAIAFDWTKLSQSDAPGATAQAGAMMASAIENAAQALATSPTDVVDIHLIGHSRGAVVIGEALADLFGTSATVMPALSAGFKKVTLLDPHPAQQAPAGPNGQPVEQWFSPGTDPLLSAASISVLNAFQSTADDPPVVIPKNVDTTEVFYQHTPSSMLTPSATVTGEASAVNLWGQVPIIAGAVKYFDLTGPNIGHSEVWMWYRDNVVLPDALNSIPSTNPGLHVPAVNIESAYLGQAYEDVLGRPVDGSGLANWVPLLNSGVPRATVISAIDHGAEYFATVIGPIYSRLLGRAPERKASPTGSTRCRTTD